MSFEIVEKYITYPSGRKFKKRYVKHPGSVLIIPVIGDEIILLKQYRYTIDKYIYELPAGTLEKGESFEECARRELLEETGYVAGDIKKILELYIAPGYSDEKIHVFLATNLKYVGQRVEEDEEIIVERHHINKIREMILKNEIMDSKSVAAILYYLNFVKKF